MQLDRLKVDCKGSLSISMSRQAAMVVFENTKGFLWNSLEKLPKLIAPVSAFTFAPFRLL